MRNRFPILAAMLLAVLPACAAAMQVPDVVSASGAVPVRPGEGCDQVEDYVAGTAVQGEFTVADCSVVEAGQREPLDVWRVRADARRDLHFIVDAPGLHVRLRLLTEDGVEVAADEYVGTFTYVVTQVPAGDYRLEVRSRGESFGGRAYGRYRLRSSTDQIGFEGCPSAAPLPAAGVLQGEWSVDDCKQPAMMRLEMRYQDYYLLEVGVRREVKLTLDSPGINGTLALFTRDGAPVDEAMAIDEPGRITRQLAPGAYVVRVGVGLEAGRETGRYTLQVR
jgi:hypothetical protein